MILSEQNNQNKGHTVVVFAIVMQIQVNGRINIWIWILWHFILSLKRCTRTFAHSVAREHHALFGSPLLSPALKIVYDNAHCSKCKRWIPFDSIPFFHFSIYAYNYPIISRHWKEFVCMPRWTLESKNRKSVKIITGGLTICSTCLSYTKVMARGTKKMPENASKCGKTKTNNKNSSSSNRKVYWTH